jgi:hypothetical protein
MAESGRAHAIANQSLDAERVEGVKRQLGTLLACDADLDVELRELDAAWERSQKAHIAAVERVTAKREAVRKEIKAAESELDVAINAPVSNLRDPTESLPDELMLMVLERVPFAALWGGACERVCQRWARLVRSASIVRRKREGRWAAYEALTIKPRRLEGHTGTLLALVVGLDGNIHSASADTTVMVWSGESGAHLHTLRGHTTSVSALAVPTGSTATSTLVHTTAPSGCGRVQVASTCEPLKGTHAKCLHLLSGWTARSFLDQLTKQSECGLLTMAPTCRRSLGTRTRSERLPSAKTVLFTRVQAIPPSGCGLTTTARTSARSWGTQTRLPHSQWHLAAECTRDRMTRRSECAGSADDSRHLQTLAGNVFRVTALVVGADGKMFSGSVDSAVRVWNSDNGSHLHTMRGNVNTVVRRTLALGRDVTLYSGGGGSLFSIKFVLKFGSARC